MLRLSSIAALIAIALGCGRFGFDSTEVAPDAALIDGAVSSPDASIDATVFPACGENTLFCDDFEGLDLGAWTTQFEGGTVELTNEQAFRGDSSVRISTLTTGALARLHQEHDVVDSGQLHVRSYWYLPSRSITAGPVEVSNSGDDASIHHHLAFDGAFPIILVNDQSAGADNEVRRDAWHCIETIIEISVAGTARLLVNETEVASAGPIDNLLDGGYQKLSIGAYSTAGASGPFEAFVDEIVVSTAPIGCL